MTHVSSIKKLPDQLATIPLRVSFLPMSGCAHFCSFCADNAGRRMRPFPFDLIRSSVRSMNILPGSVALYNACDGLNYLWKDGRNLYTVNHLSRLFLKIGAREILLSSPGLEDTPINRRILDGVAGMGAAGLMLSLNREHLLDRKKLDAFLFTVRTLSKFNRCQVRIVYTSPEERGRLMEIVENELPSGRHFSYRSRGGLGIETVPAAPLGRGRNVYFSGNMGGSLLMREREEFIMRMFRDEPCLKSHRFMTALDYEDFLQQAAVQFAGFYIILLTPTPEGMDIALKVTDLEKTVKTRGLSHSTIYRFDERLGRFAHRGAGGELSMLKLLLFDPVKCNARAFSAYLDGKGSGINRNLAARVFAAHAASDFMQDKNRVSERKTLIIMNGEYREFYRRTLETVIGLNHPTLTRDCADADVTIAELFDEIVGFLESIGEEC